MKRTGAAVACLGLAAAAAQTLPRPAAPFEFSLANETAKVSSFKGRLSVLYLFTPD